MAKKEKVPSTPESRAKKLEDKKEVRKAFGKTFIPALAICLSLLFVYSVSYISFYRNSSYIAEASDAGNSAQPVYNNSGSYVDNGSYNAPQDNSSSASNQSSSSSNNPAAPAQDNNQGGGSAAQNDAGDALTTFNTAINKVKSEASAITHVSGGTKNNGGIDQASQLPGILKSVGNSVIDAAMSSNGVKPDGSVIEASKFPVEGQSYSSQLTPDDVVSATRSGNTITIITKDDELGQADNGHNSKAFNVIKASTIMDNIPSVASSFASSAKTSAKNGKIVATIDDSGHITAVDYTFDWDIEILGNNLDAIIHLATEEHYTIAY
ncbi:MAG: hypothetical protein IJL63_00865 [Clostridia bacterium]|nr:hypothetical protein [Clostridia bacterium]